MMANWTGRIACMLAAAVIVGLPAAAKPLQQMREEGYAYAARGDCATAYEIFRAAAAKSGGAPQDHLAAGNCAVEIGDREEAIAQYYAALAKRGQLTRVDTIFALKSLAYQLEAQGRVKESCPAWEQALALREDAGIRALYARCLDLTGEPRKARAVRGRLKTFDMRDQGFKAAGREDWYGASLLFNAASERTGAARDYFALGNVLAPLPDRAEDTAAAYYRALERRRQLTRADTLAALKGVAYAIERTGRFGEAADAWQQALDMEEDPATRFQLARLSFAAGREARAREVFAAVDYSALEPWAEASYWTQSAELKQGSDPGGALADLDRAIAIEPAAWRLYRRYEILRDMGRSEEALSALAAAQDADPSNVDMTLELAYAYRAAGQNGEAIVLFEQALAADPARISVNEDLAYALKDSGRREDAAQRFRTVVANESAYPRTTEDERAALAQKIWNARREVSFLEREFYVSGYLTWRDGASFGAILPETSDGASSAGIEAGWILPVDVGGRRPFTLYARAFGGFERDSFDWRDDSLQGGIGLRFVPFETIWTTLSVERLFALGDEARDDWLFTAAASTGAGFDLDPIRDDWFMWNVYGSVSYATGEDDAGAFLSATLEGMAGRSFRVGRNTVITPHVVGELRHLDDDFTSDTVLEAGPGVLVRWWFNEDAGSAPRSHVDLRLQYRVRIAGEDGGDDGALVAGLSFYY